MGFWGLFEVATTPILQVLLIAVLGAVLATDYFNILNADARKHMNKLVFVVFTPSLMFASLAKTITLQEIIKWWFMPINVGLTFLLGGVLGWIAVKILKPEPHLEGLVIATCSAGNLGNLLLIVIPAICNEEGSPFGDSSTCSVHGIAYVSFSMALGGFYTWTYTYHLIKKAGAIYYQKLSLNEDPPKEPNKDIDAGVESQLLQAPENVDAYHDQMALDLSPSAITIQDQNIVHSNGEVGGEENHLYKKITAILQRIVDELLAPPTVAAILGFIFGAVPWLKSLLIGTNAPVRVVQDAVILLGQGTIPCITLILGGNLTQGLKTGKLKPSVTVTVLVVRYLIFPLVGLGVVQAVQRLGFLSPDPLYQYVLMIQFTVPPAMNIGTMTELFDVAQDECSVLLLWSYLVAALALTIWSTVYMWILS